MSTATQCQLELRVLSSMRPVAHQSRVSVLTKLLMKRCMVLIATMRCASVCMCCHSSKLSHPPCPSAGSSAGVRVTFLHMCLRCVACSDCLTIQLPLCLLPCMCPQPKPRWTSLIMMQCSKLKCSVRLKLADALLRKSRAEPCRILRLAMERVAAHLSASLMVVSVHAL